MTRRKRSLTTNQWVFGLKRKQKRNKMVTLGADHQPRPSCDATILNEFVFGNHISSVVKRMNIQFLVFTAGAQLGFCSSGWGELEPKDQVIPKNVALGRRAKQTGLTYAHHRRGLEVEPKAAEQFLCFFWNKQLLFEHHSNQVWYLLEPSEKNNALNFESQLKNWVAQPLHAPVSLTYRPCPKRENTIFLIKCCEYMKNNVWQQNEINVLKFWLSFLLTKLSWNRYLCLCQ